MRTGVRLLVPLVIAVTGLAVACGTTTRRGGFDDEETKKADVDSGAPGVGFTPEPAPCHGLACKVVECDEGTTTLTGKVYDPAGANPLPNVQVYIPDVGDVDEELPPLKDSTVEGIACEPCGSVAINPLTSALTNARGEFVLEDVPVADEVPVVIQVGKWRRKVMLAVENACAENAVADRTLKLPRNGSEGDMPQIAVTTGGFDALECLLRGIGIDDDEFVQGHGGTGHVHLFKGSGGGMGPPAEDFWNDFDQLTKYDLVLLSCEGTETLTNKGGNTPGARSALYDYLNSGGRVFATHFHYVWFRDSPASELRTIADWGSSSSGNGDYDVDTSFPKGQMLAEWLVATGASSTLGKVPLRSVTGSVKEVYDPGITWIQKPNAPKYFSFNTPLSAPEEEQCGRAVFSDLHITDKYAPKSMSECSISSGALNAQQKALEFLFFDLSSCVQSDKVPPQPTK